MKIKWNETYTTIAAYVILVFLICYSIFKITDNITVNQQIYSTIFSALVPFLIALLISYFLYPLVDFIEGSLFKSMKSQKYRRFLAITASYLLVIGLGILLLSFVVPQILQSLRDVTGLVQKVDSYIPEIEKILDSQQIPIFNSTFYIDLTLVNRYIREINLKETLNSFSELLSGIIPALINLFTRFASGFLNVLLGMIVAIYMLAGKEKIVESLNLGIRSVFSKKGAENMLDILKDSHTIFNGFIIGSLIDALIITVLTFILMIIFRIDYPLLISIIVGITNLIPYFGPIIGGAIGAVLLVFVSPMEALTFSVIILGIQQFDGNILKPRIFGQSVGLGPIWVIFSIFLFGKLFGFVGMFLGVPIFTIFKNMVSRHLQKKYKKKYPDFVIEEEPLPYDIHHRD